MSKNEAASKETSTKAKTDKKPAFKVKRNLTLPLLKLTLEQAYHIKLTDKHFIGKEIKGIEGEAKKQPAVLINIIDLETGEPMQMILNKVLQSILDEEFENDSYVGVSIRIVKHAKKQ